MGPKPFQYLDRPHDNDPTVTFSDSLIGQGTQSRLYEGTYCGKRAACKFFEEKETDCGRDEVQILKHLDHRNIVKMYCAFLHSSKGFVVVMELLSAPLSRFSDWLARTARPLFDVVDGTGNVYFKLFLSIFTDVTAALVYLHEKNIRHCDIKPDNILLKFYNAAPAIRIVAKVCDFGIARKHPPDGDKEERGSPTYMAPELISDDDVMTPGNCASDIYSFGSTMIEILTGERPTALNAERHDQWSDISRKLSCSRCSFTEPCRGNLCFRLIVGNCINVDPASRPMASQLLLGFGELASQLPNDQDLNLVAFDRRDFVAPVFDDERGHPTLFTNT